MIDYVNGMHHITLISANLQTNYDFYTKVLGLQCVKRTVNHDDPTTTHIYYGDAIGSPGTLITFFIIPNLKQGMGGQGAVVSMNLGIPQNSLDYWIKRLESHDVVVDKSKKEKGEISFSDREGMHIRFQETNKKTNNYPKQSDVPKQYFMTHIVGFDYHSRKPNQTKLVLSEVLGFKLIEKGEAIEIYQAENGHKEDFVKVIKNMNVPLGYRGAGSVHHVAFSVEDEKIQEDWQTKIRDAGIRVSPITDRIYFKSIYFRGPGGILYEIATKGPGQKVSGDEIGTNLVLPKWLENQRKEIEENLPEFKP